MAETTSPLGLEIARQTGSCACFNLRKATRLVTQLYDEKLRPLGLRATQFTLLVVIRLRGPVAVNELAETLVMDRTTLTRNLKPLEREGLIVSQPGSDRRVREVLLSPEGHETLKQAHPLWQDAQAEVARSLGEAHFGALLTELSATVEAMRDAVADEASGSV